MPEKKQHKDNKDKYFKGQLQDEEVILFLRRHWVALFDYLAGFLGMTILFVLVFGTTFFRSFIAEYRGILTFLFLLYYLGSTLFIHKFFLRLLNHFSHVVVITDQRIVYISKTVYVHSMLDSLRHTQIQDVRKEQEGIIKNWLNYGELCIVLTTSEEPRTLHYVPNPEYHFRMINRCITEANKRALTETEEVIKGEKSIDEIKEPVQGIMETLEKIEHGRS